MLRVKFSVKSALSQGAPTPLVYLSSCDLEALTVSSIFPSNFGNPRDFSCFLTWDIQQEHLSS